MTMVINLFVVMADHLEQSLLQLQKHQVDELSHIIYSCHCVLELYSVIIYHAFHMCDMVAFIRVSYYGVEWSQLLVGSAT